MTLYLSTVVVLLLVALFIGLARQWYSPSKVDRILALQLFSTLGVAILILLALIAQAPALINVALVLALLAPLTIIIVVRLRR